MWSGRTRWRKANRLYMKRLTLLFTLLLSLSLVGCRERSEVVTIDLFATGDVHGSLFPESILEGADTGGGVARVATVVRSYREQPEARPVLLLDAGDLLQGQPLTYYFNVVDTLSPHAVAEMYNYLGYDAMTVGNHDIETGHGVYDRFVREADFPVLGANVVNTATGKPYFKPYVVVEKGGKKIAILGLTMPTLTDNLPPHLWSGLEFRDQVETARAYLPEILSQRPDLLICLMHSGPGKKEGDPRPMAANVGYDLAKAIPEADIVLCAHDHRAALDSIPRETGRYTYILDAGADGRLLSHCEISLGVSGSGKPVVRVAPELIDLSAYEPDGDFMEHFASSEQQVRDFAAQPVGQLTAPMDSRSVFFRPAPFTDLIHRLQLEIFPEAEVSLTAPLVENLVIPAGPIRMADLFNLYKYENYAYLMRLRGSELKAHLEESYDRIIRTMSSPEDPLYRIDESKRGGPYLPLEGPSFNFDTAAGISYLVDVTRPSGDRIEITGVGKGRPFDPDEEYLVVMSSYRAQGGGGLLTSGAGIPKQDLPGRVVRTTDRDLRYYLIDFFERHNPYTPRIISSWTYVPDAWARVAVPRDSASIFRDFPRP